MKSNDQRPCYSTSLLRQMFALFDYAFREGVLNAAHLGDNVVCEEFLREYKLRPVFVLLDTPRKISWTEWRFVIGRWASSRHLAMLTKKFLTRRGYNWYVQALYRVVQDFYFRGIEEWLKYSNPLSLEVFKGKARVHWAPMGRTRFKAISNADFIAMAQEFAYARMSVVREVGDNVSTATYELFAKEIWWAKYRDEDLNAVPGDY